jgi:predicted dehydrogenase
MPVPSSAARDSIADSRCLRDLLQLDPGIVEMTSPKATKIAVVGVGHFGAEHARVYSACEGVDLVALCDVDAAAGRKAPDRFAIEFVSDYRELIGRVDAVSIAVPTVLHYQIACEFMEAGVSVLVEKPIAATLEQAHRMVELARERGVVLQVGHLERFNPAVSAARAIATTPRFFEAHRLSVFTSRSLDIDVVMDLMIHDIDIVLSLVQSPVAEVRAAGVPVITPRIDIANARIEFEDGCIANLTASRVSAERVRKMRFFQPAQYVSIDYSAQEAATVSVQPATAGGPPVFNSSLLPVDRAEPLELEILSFLRALRGGPVEVSGAEGHAALALALSVTAKIQEHWTRTRAYKQR